MPLCVRETHSVQSDTQTLLPCNPLNLFVGEATCNLSCFYPLSDAMSVGRQRMTLCGWCVTLGIQLSSLRSARRSTQMRSTWSATIQSVKEKAMCPNSDAPEWHAHFNCAYCHGLKAKADVIFCDGKPICRIGDCKNAFYAQNHPHPVVRSLGYYDKGWTSNAWHASKHACRNARGMWRPWNGGTRLLRHLQTRWCHRLARVLTRRAGDVHSSPVHKQTLRASMDSRPVQQLLTFYRRR